MNQPSCSKIWQLTWTSKIARVPLRILKAHTSLQKKYVDLFPKILFKNAMCVRPAKGCWNHCHASELRRPNLTGIHASWQRICLEEPQHRMRPVRNPLFNTKLLGNDSKSHPTRYIGCMPASTSRCRKSWKDGAIMHCTPFRGDTDSNDSTLALTFQY